MAEKGEDSEGPFKIPLITRSISTSINAIIPRDSFPRLSRRRRMNPSILTLRRSISAAPRVLTTPSKNSLEFSYPNKETAGQGYLQLEHISEFVINLISNTITNNPQHCIFRPGQLASLRIDVKIFLKSEVGPFLFERLQALLLPQGMALLREQLQPPIDLALSKCWPPFYRHVLPTLVAIFVQEKYPTGWDITSIRNAVLISFRDELVLHFHQELLESPLLKKPINMDLRNMLLVLQGVKDSYPPNEQQLQLEPLVARVVSPYLGFKGFYLNGNSEPDVVSEELLHAHLRRPSVVDPRRLQRPLSVSSGLRVTTLTDLFREAHLRQRESFI